jgi:hypothetical protein
MVVGFESSRLAALLAQALMRRRTVCVSRGWTDERRPSGKALGLILRGKSARVQPSAGRVREWRLEFRARQSCFSPFPLRVPQYLARTPVSTPCHLEPDVRRIGGQRVAFTGTFPTALLRTARDRFRVKQLASGS